MLCKLYADCVHMIPLMSNTLLFVYIVKGYVFDCAFEINIIYRER